MHTNNDLSLKIWEVSHFAVLSYELSLNTHCNALTLALHIVTNKRIMKDTTKFLSVQPTQQFYFCIIVFQLFYPTPASSSRILKTILKLPSTCPFSRSFRGLVSWEPYISVKCELGDCVEFWSQFVSLDVT